MTIDEMKKRRQELYHNYVSSTRHYVRARRLHQSLKERAEHDERLYRQCEYELAVMDGRKHVIEEAPKRKEKRVSERLISLEDLTYEQKLELAELLGIEREVDEEELIS
jgi:hypothetical protein